MSSEPAIQATGLSKCYTLYERPFDRLRQLLRLGKQVPGRQFWALQNVSFELGRGEVLGIIGRNGAGKSTLLQLVCGTLLPTTGSIALNGRIAALLELGAGFNPEFTGKENVYLNASILGLSNTEIAERYDEIVAFSGIGEFIDQPVKTYSSGMYLRLAFSVAVSTEPDILIVDEALAVGDGEFARKSFDRIMALKDAGKTILFCSHSMYQIEALCSRALWLNKGEVKLLGDPGQVVTAYHTFLALEENVSRPGHALPQDQVVLADKGCARIAGVAVSADGVAGRHLPVRTLETTVTIRVEFASDPALPVPSVAVGFIARNGTTVASAGSQNDSFSLTRDASGNGAAIATFPEIPLLKGDYSVSVILMCERGVHIYDHVEMVAELQVSQQGLEQGIVALPHSWQTEA